MIYLFIFFFVGNLLFASSNSDSKDLITDIPVESMKNKIFSSAQKSKDKIKNTVNNQVKNLKNSAMDKLNKAKEITINAIKNPFQNLKNPINNTIGILNPVGQNPTVTNPLPVALSDTLLKNAISHLAKFDLTLVHQFLQLDGIVAADKFTNEMISDTPSADPATEKIRAQVIENLKKALKKSKDALLNGNLLISQETDPNNLPSNNFTNRVVRDKNKSFSYFIAGNGIYIEKDIINSQANSIDFHVNEILTKDLFEILLAHLNTLIFYKGDPSSITAEHNQIFTANNFTLVQLPKGNITLFDPSTLKIIFPNNIGLTQAFLNQMKLVFEPSLKKLLNKKDTGFYFLSKSTAKFDLKSNDPTIPYLVNIPFMYIEFANFIPIGQLKPLSTL